jgi:hypothetical protein
MELIFITTMLQGITLLMIIAIVFTASQLVRRRKSRNARSGDRLANTPLEAHAVVLTMEDTGVFMNQQPLVKMQMQVLPDRGRNFVVEVREVLSGGDRATIRSGSTVRVRYNPANPKDTTLVKTT